MFVLFLNFWDFRQYSNDIKRISFGTSFETQSFSPGCPRGRTQDVKPVADAHCVSTTQNEIHASETSVQLLGGRWRRSSTRCCCMEGCRLLCVGEQLGALQKPCHPTGTWLSFCLLSPCPESGVRSRSLVRVVGGPHKQHTTRLPCCSSGCLALFSSTLFSRSAKTVSALG